MGSRTAFKSVRLLTVDNFLRRTTWEDRFPRIRQSVGRIVVQLAGGLSLGTTCAVVGLVGDYQAVEEGFYLVPFESIPRGYMPGYRGQPFLGVVV